MVGIILASHGEFAKGILQSSQMIFGEQENIIACCLMPSEGPEDIRKKMEDAIASFDNPEQVLILADLWGGTPFNQACTLLNGHEDSWAIMTGLNLAMLVEALGQRFMTENAQEIVSNILQIAKDAVRAKPESLEPVVESAAPAQTAPVAAIPEGTVLGDGKIKYALARIDTRLLHGQVATNWSKTVQPDRIIVVSDAVAHDDLRKGLIMQAAPPGIKAHVVPIEKMMKVAKDVRFGDTKAMLLFETPQDALRAIEGGVDIKTINVGSMAHTKGKIAVNKAISLGAEDIQTFAKLKELGVSFDVRKVPGDSPEDMEKLIADAKSQLGIK